MKRKYLFLWFVFLYCGIKGQSQQIEDLCRQSTLSHSNMWWVNSIKTTSPLVFAVQTNKYAFEFNYEELTFADFSIAGSKQFVTPPEISFGIETYGKLYPCGQSSLRVEDCQLIHTGRFLQHRFINWIPGLTGCDPYQSGLEVISWSDRLTLSLRVVPTVIQRSKSIVITYELPAVYQKKDSPDGWLIYKNSMGKDGYIITGATDDTEITFSGNLLEARVHSPTNLQPDSLYHTGFIIYPVEDLANELVAIIQQEEVPLIVSAEQIAPVHSVLTSQYDKTMGWHSIMLRNDIIEEITEDNKRMERVRFTIENKNSSDATVRLNFNKEDKVYAISGISGMIRDGDGIPTGIPVQLSKNWHTIDFNQYASHLYRGPWFHGLSTLLIPANSKITLEYTGVNALWGGVPAASHAQLCLVGWGSNQQWDQSAIGAWGESICYEPDLDQASAAVLDVRPLFTLGPQDEKWRWGGNVGGADILYLQQNGDRVWHTAMKTYYKRYCPNLTEVVYAGSMLDEKIKFQYTTSVGRSDDLNRGIYRIKMEVHDDVEFEKLDIFQLGAERYHYGLSKKIAVGDETGLIKKWNTDTNGKSQVDIHTGVLSGKVPWVAMYDSPISKDQEGRFTSGNRGFVVRNWNAVINGKKEISPHWKEYRTTAGNHGAPCSIVTITLPEGCHTLSSGDYIEAEIEMLALPLNAGAYYGPNGNFQKALEQAKEEWTLVYREAVGNSLNITASMGVAISDYPVVIRAEKNQAEFKVKGGIGYVPVTLSGLSVYKKPVLYVKKGDKWLLIDQSEFGNDYWQTDFDASNGTWAITYNINLDSSNDKPEEREFRFRME